MKLVGTTSRIHIPRKNMKTPPTGRLIHRNRTAIEIAPVTVTHNDHPKSEDEKAKTKTPESHNLRKTFNAYNQQTMHVGNRFDAQF